ncbi:hypothetical protein REPUB_Repub11eG0182600 [Reevesia pubescens]
MAKRPSTQIMACIFFIVLVLHSFPGTSDQEVEDEREFDYTENSKKGPSKWGEIHPEWGMLKTSYKPSYKPSNATLKNRGHDIMLRWEGEAGVIEINGTEYALQQCHWHSSSEHTINGRKLMDHLAAITNITEGERAVGTIDPRDIKIGSKLYYSYIGSLTVPPCTENVVWNIVKKVSTVTKEQVRLLRVVVHDASDTNAKPLQAINKRLIQFFRTADDEEN